MIIVDTNVISEVVKRTPSHQVIQWLDDQNTLRLFTTSVTLAELNAGIAALPTGKRKTLLSTKIDHYVEAVFGDRVLSFTRESAGHYGSIVGRRKSIGRPIGVADAQIAALTVQHHFRLATRNTKDFEECGVELLDPWSHIPHDA